MINEHDRVVLLKDVYSEGLKTGDVGTVVHVYRESKAFEVEFMTLDGGTVAVVTLPASDVRPVSNRDITHVRELLAA